MILPADGGTINDRRKLALNGQISLAVAIGRDGRVIGSPQVRLQGIPVEEDRGAFIDDVVQGVEHALRDRPRDPDKMRESLRLAVRKVATRWTGKKPIVDVLVIQG